jgi:hypothetical protein
MGFFIFAATAIAFSAAAVISAGLGAVGIILYIWRGRGGAQSKRVFWYVLIGGGVIGIIMINLIPFPHAPAGSNYSEWMTEWVVNAAAYALTPGAACLLGGIASVFARMMARKD